MRFIRCLSVLIFFVITVLNISITGTYKEEAQCIKYIIRSSDTLWNIAQEYKNPGEDTRQYICKESFYIIIT